MILKTLAIDPAELRRRTGWEIQPEGACKGNRCVPLPHFDGERIDAQLFAERLGMPLIHDEPTGLWCLGPEAGERALETVDVHDLVLPDIHGQDFHLHGLRGRKVLLVAWASW